jgi:hypothetical protein
MPRHLKYGLLALLIITTLGVAYYFNLQGRIRRLVLPTREPVQPFLSGRPYFPESAPTRRVTLFFPSRVRDGMLEPELRDIHSSAQWTEEAKQIIGELIRGSSEGRPPALPMETRLRSVYWAGEGLCVVDLTREASHHHPGGLTSEVSSVYAVVNSLTENLTAVRKVQILIEGNEVDTLAGHVDIGRPLLQDLSMTPLPPRN